MNYPSCPKCGIKKGLIYQPTIYKCKKCGRAFCQECKEKSNGKCPYCGHQYIEWSGVVK